MTERRILVALLLIFLGIILFLGNFIPIFNLKFAWPLLIVIAGLGIMFNDIYRD